MRIRSETSRRTVGDGDIFVAHIVRCGNPKPQFDRAVGDGDITSMFRAHVGLNYAAVFNGSVFAGTLPPTVGTVGYKHIVASPTRPWSLNSGFLEQSLGGFIGLSEKRAWRIIADASIIAMSENRQYRGPDHRLMR